MSRRTVVFSCICLLAFGFGSIVLAQQAGSVSVKELDSLLEKEIILPRFTFFDLHWDEDWGVNSTFAAGGTWAGAGMFPISFSWLECSRPQMECHMDTATVRTGPTRWVGASIPSDWTDGTEFLRGGLPMLTLKHDSFDIDTWTRSEIISKPDRVLCMWSTLVISRKSKAVTRTRVIVKVDGECDMPHRSVGLKVGQTFSDRLEDGQKAWISRVGKSEIPKTDRSPPSSPP